MSGDKDVLSILNPPDGDIGDNLHALGHRLDELTDKEKSLSKILSLFDQKNDLSPLSAAEKEMREKYAAEFQQVQDEKAQLENERDALEEQASSSVTVISP
jgi:Mg2+ and Co2+ transporter CorA